MASIAGVVLAGGHGTRLGGAIKAKLRVSGQSLIAIALDNLSQQAAPVAISIGHLDPAYFAGWEGVALLPDGEGVDIGPIGGMAIAVAWCGTLTPAPDFLLTMAVDAPFGPADFAARSLEAIEDGTTGVVASCAGQLHPTHSLWRVPALRDLPVQVVTGTAPKSLKALAYEFEARILDAPKVDGRDPFDSINTVQDLLAANRISRTSG
jgi:molybdopterin-guanine dinucleotide biosynthesis protein A